jgi:SAM-dependent methyltransferase
MDEVLAHWLRLREATDWASRSSDLTREVAERLAAHDVVHVLDLATGTGSNLRYLVERLPPRQRWLLVDRSPDLLSLVYERTAAWAVARGYTPTRTVDGFVLDGHGLNCLVTTRQMDLDLPLDRALFDTRDLVTGSAILDLVSESWLRALATCCQQAGAAALFALTYNGQSSFVPPEPEDDLLRDLLNAHQLRDKGLGGPATGPAAHATAAAVFGEVGYVVQAASSDWMLDTSQRDFQGLLAAGLADAALEQRPDLAARIRSWRARRQTHVDTGCSQAIVGHHDLAAWPPAP